MTTLNSYLGVIKLSAKALQEKAAKISDAVDVQLQKTQENFERLLFEYELELIFLCYQ